MAGWSVTGRRIVARSIAARSIVARLSAGTLLAGALLVAAAYGYSATEEAHNLEKGRERSTVYMTPAYQALLVATDTRNELATAKILRSDPGRAFATNSCARDDGPCAGDVRLYHWNGIVRRVLFTARNGATLSGRVWATRAGPRRRPGVVITAGSLGADEQMYWYLAEALARAGFVVMTWDPQGQGQSDTHGESPDQNEGYPAQTDGRPYFDGTEDALNFFLSTAPHRYEPVRSCTTGTSHAAKQNERVAEGLDAAYDPLWRMLNRREIGLAGHSYGATGVSYIGQWDPRVKAIVALDNLRVPSDVDNSATAGLQSGGLQPSGESACPADPAARSIPPITKPALGFSADYYLYEKPYTSDPDPLAKSVGSLAYTKAGVDTGEIIIRGGTHYEFSWIPSNAFPATLRGADLVTWYTTAWFDKYLRHAPRADAMLLSDRWRHDADEAAVDPTGDGNVFSFYYRSRLDIHLADGSTFDCEDLRAGCPGLTAADGHPGDYSYLKVDTG